MRINVLNKEGMLTEEDRKAKLAHGCDHLTFETCLDLSEPIKIYSYGSTDKVSLTNYSKDIASFITWWTIIVLTDLNGFSGFHNVRFEPIGFTVIQ